MPSVNKLHVAGWFSSKQGFPAKVIFGPALLLSQAFPGGWGGGEGWWVLVWKNLLLCAHRPIGGKIWATDEFWAPTQSGFFRTIGKGGKRAEAVLYCFCTTAYATGTLMLQLALGEFYMNFQYQASLFWCIPRRLLSDQFHEICQTASTAFIHLAKEPVFFPATASRCVFNPYLVLICSDWPQFEM